MLKTTIIASYIDGSTRKLPGYSIAPGLAVHRAVTMTGEETSDWNVVHTPSGFRVCGSFPTRKMAVEAATEFGPLTDWTLPVTKNGEVWEWRAYAQNLVTQVFNIRNRILYAGPLFKPANPIAQNQGRLF
jgi:hypothetical protein